MFESEKNQRRVGRFAWVMAWVGLVVGQMHALSRFATAAGKEDLELPLTAVWAEPATDLLAPLLTWAGYWSRAAASRARHGVSRVQDRSVLPGA